jgi:Flp pilus assembly protein TadG
MFRGSHARFETAMSARRGRRRRDGHCGQSLVEFALILPILLLLALIAVDFGRIYLGWINLQNLTRIGANFAANNATAMFGNDPDTIAEYRNLILNDAQRTNCALNPAQPDVPAFTDTDGDLNRVGLGDRASVTLTCRFHVITPLIALIVGSDVSVTTTSAFPVKSAIAAATSGGGGGGGGGCTLPSPAIRATPATSGPAPLTVNFLDASGGGAGTGWLWDFGDPAIPDSTARDPGDITFTNSGTWTVTLTVSNTCGSATTNPGTTITVSSAPALCVVPDFNDHQRSEAQGLWTAAGFNTTVQPTNGNWKITSQTIVAGSSVPCTGTTITVGH